MSVGSEKEILLFLYSRLINVFAASAAVSVGKLFSKENRTAIHFISLVCWCKGMKIIVAHIACQHQSHPHQA